MSFFSSVIFSGLFLCALFTGSLPAYAEPVLLDEITVRGQLPHPTEQLLSIREVRESPARDMGEALQAVPGLSCVRKGAIANDIVLRGFQRDNLNVFLDGVRLHGGCPSRMDPPSFHFDFAEVESIQIIKGPYDLSNPGSLAGMVNAISKAPRKGPGFSANLSYGSYDYLDASATAAYGGENADALFGYAYKSSDVPKSGDGKWLTEIYPDTSPNRYRPDEIDSKAYDMDTVWAKGGFQHAGGRSELSLAYQNAEHVLYPYLLMDAAHDRTRRVNWTSQLENLGPVIEKLKFQAWYNDVDHLMHDEFRVSSTPSATVTRSYSMQTDAETWTGGIKLNTDIPFGPGTLTTGADFYRRNWDAVNRAAMWQAYLPQPMIPDVDIDNLGAFAEYVWPLGDGLSLKGGARIDYTSTDAQKLDAARLAALYQPYLPGKDLDNETDYTEPSANLQLTWQASDALELFAGIASASRTPDPQELFLGLQRMMGKNQLGNPDLDPVRNNQVDLGLKWTGTGLFASLSGFYSDLRDYIYVVDVPDPDGAGPLIQARTYRNIDATLWGGELDSQVAFPLDLYLRGTLAYVRGENDDTNEPLSEIPPLTGSLGLRYDNGDWFAEATERFADRQNRVDESLNEEETAGWAATDVKAGANWENWSLVGGVNNLFDRYYFSHLSYQRDPFASGVKVPEVGLFAYLRLAYKY